MPGPAGPRSTPADRRRVRRQQQARARRPAPKKRVQPLERKGAASPNARRGAKGQPRPAPRTIGRPDTIARERKRARDQRRGTSVTALTTDPKLLAQQVRRANRAYERNQRRTFGPAPGRPQQDFAGRGRRLTQELFGAPPALQTPGKRRRATALGPNALGGRTPSNLEKLLAETIATGPIPVKGLGPLARIGGKAVGSLIGKAGAKGAGKTVERAATKGLKARPRTKPLTVKQRARRTKQLAKKAKRQAQRGPIRQGSRRATKGVRAHAPAPTALQAERHEEVRRAPQVPIQTARAFYEDPLKVGPRTATGLAQIAGAVVAAPAQFIQRSIAEGPDQALHEFLEGLKQDYKRRYGPLLRGEKGAEEAFRKRIKKEGAAGELLDIGGVAAIGGATIGRAAGAAARRAGRGPYKKGARPRLQLAPGRTQEQDLSANLFRAAGQRTEDIVRRRRFEKRKARGIRATTPTGATRGTRGLIPKEGEVVRGTLRGQKRGQRYVQSLNQSRAHTELRIRQHHEIDQGAKREWSKLNKGQRKSTFHVLQGMVSADNPAAARLQLAKRKADIIEARRGKVMAGKVKPGAYVRAADRDNVGRIVSIDGDTATVRFVNRAEGTQATVELPIDSLTAASKTGKPIAVPLKLRRTNEELRAIRYLERHAETIFTPELERFRAAEVARSKRLEGDLPAGYVREDTAEVRRYRPQGEQLGIVHEFDRGRAEIDTAYRSALARHNFGHDPDIDLGELNAKYDEIRRALDEHKPTLDAKYVADVKAGAERAGLPEPLFISHRPRPAIRRSDRTAGSGNRAVAGTRKSNMTLLREGRADVSPEAYFDTLARQIKVDVSWNLTHKQMSDAAESFTPKQMLDALGRVKKPTELTIRDLQRLRDHLGMADEDWAFLQPGRLQESFQSIERRGGEEPDALDQEGLQPDLAEATPEVHAAVRDAVKTQKELDQMPAADRGRFLETKGALMLPKPFTDELLDATKPSGAVGRTIAKGMGFQSRLLLATSPSWLPFQVLANSFVTGIAVRGNVYDATRTRQFFKSLPEDQERAVSEMLGAGGLRGHAEKMHLGSTGHGAIIDFWRAMGNTAFMRRASKANPLDLVFRMDEAQNAWFRRTILYNGVKKEAYKRMGQNTRALQGTSDQITSFLSRPKLEDQMRELLGNPEVMERHARRVNDLLGDFSRYSAAERRYFKRGVIFYGFFRYALRLAFYTMPIQHPVMTAMMGKLAQLHTEEVKDLVGGDEAPWAYSRVFFGNPERDFNQRTATPGLQSIDVLRANPVATPITAVLDEGPANLAGLSAPVFAALFDLTAGQSLFHGRPLRKGPGASETFGGKSGFDPVAWTRFLADRMGSLHGGYRLGETLTQRGTQADTSLLGSERRIHYKRADAIERERIKRRQEGTARDELQRFLAPMFFPRPDTTARTIKGIRRRKGKKGGGSRRAAPLTPGGGGGGLIPGGSGGGLIP